MQTRKDIIITETPRDAMQGWHRILSVEEKAAYMNLLLKAGFDTVDVGSLVSPKAVPQMADTVEVIHRLEVKGTASSIMVVAGNRKGALRAAPIREIQKVGFPYSTSPTFLKRNINADPGSAWHELLEIRNICSDAGKMVRVYLSMAFGNPYGDPWSEGQILEEVDRLSRDGFRDIVFSDITGVGTAESIGRLCNSLVRSFGDLDLGIHLHTKPGEWEPKVEAAWQAGFRRFEGAMGGFGGCPMSGYELLGNLDTSNLLKWCAQHQISTGIDNEVMEAAKERALKIFV